MPSRRQGREDADVATDLTSTIDGPRLLRAEWARLVSSTPPADRFDAADLGQLPEPARRWLVHAVPSGMPLWSSVELRMQGRIKIGAWRSFMARQVITPPQGFIWAATAHIAGVPVTGFDRYSSGTGQMRWRLAGLVPVMSGTGPDVTRSAAGRLAGEATCWLPTAFRAAAWSDGPGPDRAVATWRIGDQVESVGIRVAPDGRLLDLLMQRWGNPGGQPSNRYPFGVTVEAERAFGDVLIPSAVRAGWWWGAERQDAGEFFSAEVTDATFG
jgi:hypothetical protein